MPKSVNFETTVSEYSTHISEIQKFHAALGTVEGAFKSEVSSSGSKLTSAMGTISGSWAGDDVEVKLESLATDCIQAGLTAIENDITGGSFLSLKNTANQLNTDLSRAQSAKKDYDSAKSAYESARSTYNNTSSDDADAKSRAKSNMDSKESEMNSAKNTLNQRIYTTNTHYHELAQFVFGGPSSRNNIGGESTLGGGAPTASPTQQDTGSENPSVVTNEIPANLGEDGYYPEIVIENGHGVHAGQTFLTKNYPDNDKHSFRFVYYPEDGCYYEVNQNFNTMEGNRPCPIEYIPEGESPGDYGYRQLSPEEVASWRVL